jgi:hypothetical protein
MVTLFRNPRQAPGAWQHPRQAPGARRALLRPAGADRSPGARRPGPSVLRTLACGGRRLLGVMLFSLSILMMFTWLLLPLGLPLALFAVALIAAPDGHRQDLEAIPVRQRHDT